MELKTLVNQFLRLQGGYPLQGNDNILKIRFNNDTVVAFEESGDLRNFFLFAVIDSLIPGEELEALTEALTSNLFHKETGKAQIGYDKTTKALVLFQEVKLDSMDEIKLQEIVVSFLSYHAHLRGKFEKLGLNL